jgi:hydroxyethylthiazole kinase
MAEMVAIAGALVINIGTLDTPWVEAMLTAGREALRRGVPMVLDPVGAGATSQRTAVALRIIEECKPRVIRGNGSEIMALVNADIKSKGVDSSATSHDALSAAKSLAKSTGAVVVISGETDYITDGTVTHTVEGGNPIMTSVTGMGCTATAMVGAFAAVNPNPMEAALHAMAVMGIAGQRAAAYSKGSGSMQLNFLDELYNFSATEAAQMVAQ